MFSQTNDLQKAIDLANNGGGASSDAPAKTESSNTEGAGFSSIQDQLGVPPMPPTDGAGVPPMPAPFGGDVVPNIEAATPTDTPNATSSPTPNSEATGANPSPEAPETPETHTPDSATNTPDHANAMPPAQESSTSQTIPVNVESPADSSTPSAEQILSEDGDIAKIRENVLKDLIPLMDKVQSDPESKFEIYKDAMETLHDKALVSGAYKQASQITDENKKAESLIELMKAIDTLK